LLIVIGVTKIYGEQGNLQRELKRLQDENSDLRWQLQQERSNNNDLWQQLVVARDALARQSQQPSTFG
jgi:hypothetical protein